MYDKRFRTPVVLSAIVLALIAVASAVGLFVDGLYRDNTWTSAQLRGADFVRLFVVVPLFAGALWYMLRGSARGMLVWLGFLWLSIYDYAFYVFGAAFNELFLVYTAIFGLSILALIWALPRLDVRAIRRMFDERTPTRWASGYMFVWVVFLGGLWVAQSVAFLVTGDVPQSVRDSGHPTAIVFALDLGVLLPAVGLAAVWLWQRESWGYVLAVMVNVKGATYALALLFMGVFAERAGVEGAYDLVPLWAGFAVASTVASLVLLRSMHQREAASSGVARTREARPESQRKAA